MKQNMTNKKTVALTTPCDSALQNTNTAYTPAFIQQKAVSNKSPAVLLYYIKKRLNHLLEK